METTTSFSLKAHHKSFVTFEFLQVCRQFLFFFKNETWRDPYCCWCFVVWATSIWSQHFAAHSSFRLIRCHLKKRVASRVVIVIIIKKNKQTFQHFWGVFCFFFKSSHRSVICVTLGCSLDRRFRSSFVFSPFIITTILFLSLSLSNFFFCFYFFLSFFFFVVVFPSTCDSFDGMKKKKYPKSVAPFG